MFVPSAIPGLICAYRFTPSGEHVVLADTDTGVAVADALAGKCWLWLHLNLSDQRCARWLVETLHLPQGAVADFSEEPSRQIIVENSGHLIGHLTDFCRDFDAVSTETTWCRFLLAERFLVTGRVRAIQSADRLRKELARGLKPTNPAALLDLLIENFPDTLDEVLHRLTSELEDIEDQVLDDRHRNERRRLMLVRREAAHLHRHMRGMRRSLLLAVRTLRGLPEGVAESASRISNLDQDYESLESRARFFHDEIDAKLASETNRQLYILSALTSAFLPPSLVAGLFGMNVNWLPFAQGEHGFLVIVILAAASSALVWLLLWRLNRN